MKRVIDEITEIINRETDAWNKKDVEKLLSIFHHDMVWPWPNTSRSHDPIDWIFELGRFNYERWRKSFNELFEAYTLIHNLRFIQMVSISNEGDGAFAVVDVDTLWQKVETGENFHWKGRACKLYTKISDGQWKMIAHIGLLDYKGLKFLT